MTTTSLHPGWTVQLAIHRAVRRDARRVAAALADSRDSSADAIRAYWNDTATQLHDHHIVEDTTIWPLMRERLGGGVDALLTRNAHEHQAMAAAMENFDTALATATGNTKAAVSALQTMIDAIETHLAHEEADVLPLIPEAFTLEDIAFFSAQSAKANPPHAFLPWVLDDATDNDRAFFRQRLPTHMRTELEALWMPQRHKNIVALSLQPTAI